MAIDLELKGIVARALAAPRALSLRDLARLVSLADPAARDFVRRAACDLKRRVSGRRVSLRGLIEIGNICAKDCFYCGIRRSNNALRRYRLATDDIVRLAAFAAENDYGSLVLQGGEIESEANTAFIEDVLRRLAPFGLGVTLSLGEQTEEVYRRWHAAGAARYLLRIETSNPELYARLHPTDHSWARRVECLRALRRTGYQVGTGVMCALPGQTADDLARDIAFFGELDVDMIGMGPYIPHPDTPLADVGYSPYQPPTPAERLDLGLSLIAATRLYLHDVNIASTTALQALAPDGREQGLLAGANVIMPNLTDPCHRHDYQLYAGKPALDETAEESRAALVRSLAAIGEEINWGQRGDSPHFAARLCYNSRKSKEGNHGLE